jgi:hypothetical protein
VVKDSCFAIKGGSAQNRRKGNDANIIFGEEVSLVVISSHSIGFIYI